MNRTPVVSWLLGIVLLVCASSPADGVDISKTLHNLSATGPGAIRAAGRDELCIFCHTPHSGVGKRALWNRDLPTITYKLYASSTLEASLKQPTGSSRLCLSCHDGTTALGNMRRPPPGARVVLGPLTGRASLGTDLSDDHPISFVYDSALAAKHGQLADPSALPKSLPLDETKQLQCSTCHESHDDRFRKFLRMDDRAGAHCTACHKPRNWPGSAHATSPATWKRVGDNPWPNSPYTTVLDNGCVNCHRPHSAPHPERLLSNTQERTVCLVCHNRTVAAKNLEDEFSKFSGHPVASSNWTHDPREDPNTMPRHVACEDCHNPHQTVSTRATPPLVQGGLKGVRGVNISGATVTEATYEYEVCLKCHGIRDQTTSTGLIRQDSTRNIRLLMSPSNPSYHPVANVGRNAGMQGFEPTLRITAASLIYCSDCHGNDDWTGGGNQPRGPHGSRFTPLLEREYETNDPSADTYQNYALCYKCHNRNFLIGDQARTFPHNEHVSKDQESCAVCHDGHGSRQNSHLINFMLQDRTRKTVVSPSQKQRRLQYISLGPGRGQCFLMCHNKNHEPLCYQGGQALKPCS